MFKCLNYFGFLDIIRFSLKLNWVGSGLGLKRVEIILSLLAQISEVLFGLS